MDINDDEEIASEAYDLVEHSIQLIESKYFSDAIGVLLRASDLLSKINRQKEVKIINQKISELYKAKEKEIKLVKTKSIKDTKISETNLEEESKKLEEIQKAKLRYYNDAIGTLLRASSLYSQSNREEEAKAINQKISDLFLLKEQEVIAEKTESAKDIKTTGTDLEEESKKLEEIKSKEEKEKDLSEKGYFFIEQGTALLQDEKFDEANEKYVAAREIFEELQWKHEVSKINLELLFNLVRKKREFEMLTQF